MSDLNTLKGRTVASITKTKSNNALFGEEIVLTFEGGTTVVFSSEATDYGDDSEIHVEIKA